MNLFSVAQIFIQLITIEVYLLKYAAAFHKTFPILIHPPLILQALSTTYAPTRPRPYCINIQKHKWRMNIDSPSTPRESIIQNKETLRQQTHEF